MDIKLEKLPKGHVAFTITVSVLELTPHLDRAARTISSEVKFEGFRPGHAPYDIVKARVGEMKLYETAIEEVVRDTYPKAVIAEKIATIGSPAIDVITLAPGNPFVYRATVSVLPEVTLGDASAITIESKKRAVNEDELARALKELQNMRRKESVVTRSATKEDKVMVNMEMFLDHVPIDGGQVKNHAVILSEKYYIPGFTDQMLGVAKGATKEFELPFPKEHYQKHIAGKQVKFRVKVQDVYELQPPPIDDAFAVALGQKTLADLKALLTKNLQEEMDQKENDRQEIALLKEMVRRSKFGEIPDLLVTSEVGRMLQELEQSVGSKGGEFEKYLESIKKTRAQLSLDMTPEAIERVKTALVIRTVADKERIEVSLEELSEEIEKMTKLYSNDNEMRERITSAEGKEYVRGTMRNRKTIAFLKGKVRLT